MAQENLAELMKTLDDAWNSQDWETFRKRHAKDFSQIFFTFTVFH